MSKFGRNKPCWCGSGKKYKKCHYPAVPEGGESYAGKSEAFSLAMRKADAREKLRVMQQGLGKPIVGVEMGDYQLVATGNTVHYSKKWKTFPDFLFDYMGHVFGKEWGAEEFKKSDEEAHQIVLWHRKIVELQNKISKGDGELFSADMTGATYCYLGLAYNLYLIKHNVELQSLLVARLKNFKQFQGAYYELIVANCLIRAGFDLELEDETDGSAKHCEFSARSPATGKKYWVEAKMRSVAGLLGKTKLDSAKGTDPTSQISKHVSEALKKPAPDERLIFVDVNAEPEKKNGEPFWCPRAYNRLADRERHLKDRQQAYIFVTNFPYHRAPDDTRVGKAVLAYGLGIPDFAKVGPVTLTKAYKSKQRHSDAYAIMDSMREYPQLPETFDGRPAAEIAAGGESGRLFVGQEYFFEETEGNGTLGVVKQVLVQENKGRATVLVETRSGRNVLLESPMSDVEIEAYRKYGNAYFGELEERSHKAEDEFQLFEFFVNNYKDTSKDRLLEIAKDHPRIEQLKHLKQEDLVFAICEGYVLSARRFEVEKD